MTDPQTVSSLNVPPAAQALQFSSLGAVPAAKINPALIYSPPVTDPLVFRIKPTIGQHLTNPAGLTFHLQRCLNALRWLSEPAIAEDDSFGPKTEAALARYLNRRGLTSDGLVCSRAVWDSIDRDTWGMAAWKPTGTNKYTGRAVNGRGLTFEAARLENLVAVLLVPGLVRNVMVDRNARGAGGVETDRLSDHALGQALDLMTWYLAGHGMAEGKRILDYLATDGIAAYRVWYGLFNHEAIYPGVDKAPRPIRSSHTDPHVTHVHISIHPAVVPWSRP